MQFRTIINQLTFSFSGCDVELYHLRRHANWIVMFVNSHFTVIKAVVLHFEWIKDKGRVILSLQLLPIFKPPIKHLLRSSHCAMKFHSWTSLWYFWTVWKQLDGYLFWRPRLALNERRWNNNSQPHRRILHWTPSKLFCGFPKLV